MQDPRIHPIGWVDASGVLGHEERGFSRWLGEHLDLLGEALDLPGLTLVDREVGVGTYRLDILAVADDGSDEGLPVVIENQYGPTNHDHLGKLVTYLAGQQRGLGVWIVEQVREPHLAAIEFLNRTSHESVGYALVTVKFAPAPDDAHYVDFQVAARPNLWLKATPEAVSHVAAPERVELLSAVHELVEQPLLDAGWASVSFRGPRSAHIELRLPDTHPLRPVGYYTLRASARDFRFRNVLQGFESWEQSRDAVVALQERYGALLEERVPAGTKIQWGVEPGVNQRNDQWYAEHPDGGHRDLTPAAAAEWAVAVAGAWVRLLAEHPPTRLIVVDGP